MKELIENFDNQLEEALKIGSAANLSNPKQEIKNVLVTGLGGSGIGGTLVGHLISKNSKLPYIVNKDYFLPSFVNEHTLVIVSSYSGNTEETLQAMEIAMEKRATIACICSGGKVEHIAKENGFDFINIPGGMPPRSCLGYSFVQILFILGFHKIIDLDFKTSLENSISLLRNDKEIIKETSKSIAEKLFNKYPIIYSSADYEAVGIRFRQQLNENSKILCSHHVFPEMNHNELVGWAKDYDNIAVLMIQNQDDYSRTKKRMEICKELFSKYSDTVIELNSRGNDAFERSMYAINIADWVSFYLSEKNKVDVTEVKVIDYLKSELSKL